MRCQACDSALNDKESTRKLPSDLDYADLCDKCFSLTFPMVFYTDVEELELDIEPQDQETEV